MRVKSGTGGTGFGEWYRRDGVSVPLWLLSQSGTLTPSLLYHLLYHSPNPVPPVPLTKPRPSCTTPSKKREACHTT
ncbi:MAG: hypothetical protein FWE41_00125 [Coriobacteriia bacterium]|nr:hypothetical protein [Coriobacteriia bacterium]MCL2749871.1 hypothetical protein [Coriobacteriia bacterium]